MTEIFVTVHEYESTTPLVRLHLNLDEAEASWNNHMNFNYRGVRSTMSRQRVDEFGIYDAEELRTVWHKYA